eukprot:3117194-Rhodomonas_salina.1
MFAAAVHKDAIRTITGVEGESSPGCVRDWRGARSEEKPGRRRMNVKEGEGGVTYRGTLQAKRAELLERAVEIAAGVRGKEW